MGHQTYGHKVLTGRRDELKKIRQADGISGFPKRSESLYDTFGVGHAGTSISAALGFAAMRDQLGEKRKVVAVIGDGALTSGIALEGLNNAGALEKDVMVVLNDNRMSISPNVGGLSHYLTRIISDPTYNRFRQRITNDLLYQKLKEGIWNLTGTVPVIGDNLQRALGAPSLASRFVRVGPLVLPRVRDGEARCRWLLAMAGAHARGGVARAGRVGRVGESALGFGPGWCRRSVRGRGQRRSQRHAGRDRGAGLPGQAAGWLRRFTLV